MTVHLSSLICIYIHKFVHKMVHILCVYPPTPAYAKAGAAPGIAVGVKLAAGFALALPWPLRTGLVTVFSAGLGTR